MPPVAETFDNQEDLRLHLAGRHSWPKVARYDAGFNDLAALHRDMHEPSKHPDLVPRIRRMLAMLGVPDDEGE